MATNYPGAIDSFTNPLSSEPMNAPSHAGQHANANDAVEAIETELGTDPSGSAATVKARFDVIEANDWVTAARIAADAVGSSEIAANAVGSSELADNAVDTAAIADSAVTSAKIAAGTIVSSDVAASTFAAFGTVGNLLTANQASGTDTLADTTGFSNNGGHALASSDSAPINGTRSLTCTFVGTGAGGPTVGTNSSGYVTVAPGDVITFLVDMIATSGETYNLTPQLFTSGGGAVAGTPVGPTVTGTGSVQSRSLTMVVPATAERAILYVRRVSGADSSVWKFDRWSIHKGSSGTWAMPGLPIVGQSSIASNGAVHLSGTGTPESVITAAPGSTWLQTDSTTDVKGWIRWVKATGTGNTGWVAGPEADTGWRNVIADINAAWEGATMTPRLTLKRVGSRVTLIGRIKRVTASGARSSYSAIYTLPTGFAALSYTTKGMATALTGLADISSDSLPTEIGVARASVAGTWAAGDGVSFEVSWMTDAAWPSSLPGVAV